MSLRKPQEKSLELLDSILGDIELTKETDLNKALSVISQRVPICTDFERDFVSLTFALATGVGKTRLMGAFISFLYTQYGVKNFFVVAPGLTVYDKLKKDLGDPSCSKYVFRGLGCFSNPPQIITDDDYKQKQLTYFESDINIYIFNIAKFNSEDVNMKKVSEYLGESFYDYLSNLDDLVMIMDESHRYRAKNGLKALNELKPVLGLELTATPLYKKGSKQVPFKNVVFEYPLSNAIKDGFTRTPFAVTRSDINFYNFGDEQLDKLMLQDGITCHEDIKTKLELYAINNDKPIVKPFALVVCKDTAHAEKIRSYVQSSAFRSGKYINKVIMIHSSQRGSEKDANIQLLLEVERPDNPVEIVIHVNILKEGWDVNNLYTIIPLRTAASKILREQMVGRGLRLPFGKRTGDEDVDSVMLTAHNKFNDIIEEAKKGDSIFNAQNVIKVEEVKPEEVAYTQLAIKIDPEDQLDEVYEHTGVEQTEVTDTIITTIIQKVQSKIQDEIESSSSDEISEEQKEGITDSVVEEIEQNNDLGKVFLENKTPFYNWMSSKVEEIHREVVEKYIPIPHVKITDEGQEEYYFEDFNIDLDRFKHVPIKNELIAQDLIDMNDRKRLRGNHIDFDGFNPRQKILKVLKEKSTIDYEKCSELLYKLISQVCNHYSKLFGENGMMNIAMMYRKDVANEIYTQMMQHFSYVNGFIKEEVIGARSFNLRHAYGWSERVGLYSDYEGNIKSCLFEGVEKGVFSEVKFDSEPELLFARILERDNSVENWLRPAKTEFDITYNRGKRYVPDFVVESTSNIYLVEIKGEDRINDPDVVAKKTRGIQYCRVVSEWGNANGYKEWKYIFIPSKQVMPTSSFDNLIERFVEK